MQIKNIRVKAASGGYACLCGAGVLRYAAREIAGLGKFSSVQVVSSPRVWRAVGKSVKCGLARDGAANLHLFDDGEPKKSMSVGGAVVPGVVAGGGGSAGFDCGGGRRGGWRCGGICGGELFARRWAGACADYPGGAGGQFCRREDRREFAGGEKPGGGVFIRRGW